MPTLAPNNEDQKIPCVLEHSYGILKDVAI